MRVPGLVAVAFGLAVALAAAAPGPGIPGSVAARPAATGPAGSSVSVGALADVAVRPGVQQAGRVQANPPTTADCEKAYKVVCYQPAQIRQAYDLAPLYARGVTGRGTTIVIVDSFGSPTIRHDLTVFDQAFGLPAPPKFTIIQPVGRVPRYDPANSDMVGWAGETTLDVEYAHAIAPGASILLVETPVSETEGVHGFPQIIKAEQYVVRHHLGDVISQSFSATEQTFPSQAAVQALRGAYQLAARNHVTVLAASGDSGAADVKLDETTYYPFPVTSWPDSDPLVTAVGGTQLHVTATGKPAAPTVWNDTYNQAANVFAVGNAGPNPLASGGGRSVLFGRPGYQNGVKNVVGGQRGVPDISMSAACNGSVDTYGTYRRRAGRLVPLVRHQRGHAAVRRHRGAGRPGGGASPRAGQPGPVPARGRARPRHRGRHEGRQHGVVHPGRAAAHGARLHRRARLRPGLRGRHGGRGVLRPRTSCRSRPLKVILSRTVLGASLGNGVII